MEMATNSVILAEKSHGQRSQVGYSPWDHKQMDRRCEFDPCIREILWRRIWKPIPVFLPGESHEGGAWQAAVHGVAELDTAERLSIAQHTIYIYMLYGILYYVAYIMHTV